MIALLHLTRSMFRGIWEERDRAIGTPFTRRQQPLGLNQPTLDSPVQWDCDTVSLWRRIGMSEEIKVQSSSGNVFADLGLENSDELLIKAELVRQISNLIDSRRLTQTEAAKILGIDQPKVSALLNGKLSGFSTDRLFRFLNALGSDVEIRVIPKLIPESQAQTRIITA